MSSVLALPFEQAPDPSPSCSNNEFCQFVYDQTKITWLAESSYWVLVKPLTIVLIVVLAFLIRMIIHRSIDRLISHTVSESQTGGSLLRPLRRRLPNALALPMERRNQRARALGSVLRSIASAVVFSISAMLVLGEVGLNLGPLLASAGIAGLAIGFGAQNLVKDFIAGCSCCWRISTGSATWSTSVRRSARSRRSDCGSPRSGTAPAWSGTCATARSSGSATRARAGPSSTSTCRSASWRWTRRPRCCARRPRRSPRTRSSSTTSSTPPTVLGVEELTAEGAVLRTTAKTSTEAQWRVGRELRRRLTEALERAGIGAQITASRMFIRPPADSAGANGGPDTGQGGPT